MESETVECWVGLYKGPVAVCCVAIAGSILPVEFPAEILQSLGLKEGDYFLWRMRPVDERLQSQLRGENGVLREGDIQPTKKLESLSPEEVAEADRLFEELFGELKEDD